VLSWYGDAGRLYQAQWSGGLSATDAVWHDIGPLVTGNDAIQRLTNSVPGTAQRYYRVVVTEIGDQ
jgi:hypothetical protein